MKNLKIYEDFNTSGNLGLIQILKKIAPFFPESIGKKLDDPQLYNTQYSGAVKSHRVSTQGRKDEIFQRISDLLSEEGIDFSSFPPKKNSSEEKALNVKMAIDFGFNVPFEALSDVIAIQTTNQDRDRVFVLQIDSKSTYFSLYPADGVFLISSHFDNSHETAQAIVLDNRNLVFAQFELDYVIRSKRSDEDSYAVYYSGKNQKRRTYELAVGVVLTPSGKIEEVMEPEIYDHEITASNG